MNNTTKKVLTIISILAGICLVISFVLYGTYYFTVSKSYNDYEKKLKTTVDKVNELNNSVNSLLKDQTIDTELSKKLLPDKISELTNIKNTVQAINPTDKYYKAQNNLVDGINYNILIYKQILSIISNPDSKDIDKSLQSLKDYKDKCLNSYSLFNLKNEKISLTSSSLKFIDNSIFYSAELLRLNKDKSISDSQNLDFINNIDLVLNGLLSLKSDYNVKITSSRTSKNYDSLLLTISQNKTSVDSIKSNLSSIIIPANGVNLYKALKDTLDNYTYYLDSINKAVAFEKASKNPSDSSIESNYIFAKDKYSLIDTKLDIFYKEYADFKNKISN